jgi:hypothetical protein
MNTAACRLSLAVVALTLNLAGTSMAQAPGGSRSGERQTMMMTTQRGGPGGALREEPALQPEFVKRVARVLKLAPEQVDAASSLQRGYIDAPRPKLDELRRAQEEANEAFRESRDISVFEGIADKQAAARVERDANAKAFLEDFKATLSGPQLAAWPRVERAVRRERLFPQGGGAVSGDRVDVARLVESIATELAAGPEIDPVLERWETGLDTLLTEREDVRAKMPKMDMGALRVNAGGPGAPQAPGAPSVDDLQKHLTDMTAVGVKLRDHNLRAARDVGALLPAERRDTFSEALRRETYPNVFGPRRRAGEALKLALGFADLSAEQRKELEALGDRYRRDSQALDDRAVAAVKAQDDDLAAGKRDNTNLNISMTIGGDGASMSAGDGEAVKAALRERRELEARTLEAIKKQLNTEQAGRLPAASTGERVIMQ